jgi:glyoxylase-like metal-dependent hydrolase (beta-lactamase superfamily II)
VVKLFKPLPAAPPDFTLEDGETLERFGLDATVLHTPGHTPGHTSLVLAGGAAFAADLIGKTPSPRLQTLLATDWEQLPASLAHFQAAQPEWVYTGHSRRPFDGETLQQIPRD